MSMSSINNISVPPHRIRVKLCPNYFPHPEGMYIARTSPEAALNIEKVCAALMENGRFTGSYDELVGYVNAFFAETAFQLCEGFSVNTGYFSIHPDVGGVFNSVNDVYDPRKHPVNFRFRAGAGLRRLVEHVEIEIEGLADTAGYIDEFLDTGTDTVNDVITGGELFVISGHKIKVAGDDPDCGVYFESVRNSGEKAKVMGRLAENSSSRIIGVVPALEASRSYRAVVITQFAGSGGKMLSKPRIMTSGFELTSA